MSQARGWDSLLLFNADVVSEQLKIRNSETLDSSARMFSLEIDTRWRILVWYLIYRRTVRTPYVVLT